MEAFDVVGQVIPAVAALGKHGSPLGLVRPLQHLYMWLILIVAAP